MDSNVQASLYVLSYSKEKVFDFKELKKIGLDKEEEIEFSLLIQIKEEDRPEKKWISIELIKIVETKKLEDKAEEEVYRQKLSRLHLGKITQDEIEEEDEDEDEEKLVSGEDGNMLFADKWKYRQIIKYNFKNVPTKGKGNYAVALFLVDSSKEKLENIDDEIFLDCAYFEVI